MSNKLVLGIIGCGMIADFHIKDFLKIDTITIKWACDVSDSALKIIKNKYNIPMLTSKYENILNDETVDAVIICTPPHTHYKIAYDSLKAKKHILLEKPAVINAEEAAKLKSKILQHPELIVLDCSARHSRLQPKFAYIKSFIDSGILGQIYYIHHRAVYRNLRPGIEYHPDAKWFFNKELSGGGPLIDWGVYDLSFHLGILNDTPHLETFISQTINGLDKLSFNNDNFDVEEHGMVAMRLSPNLFYCWERASNAHQEQANETRVYGTRGGLSFNYLVWESNEVNYYYLDNDGKPKNKLLSIDMANHTTNKHDSFEMCKHFINCIINKEKPILPIELSLKHLNIIFEILSAPSIKSNAQIRIS